MLDVEFLRQARRLTGKNNATLVAVSKTQPNEKIMQAYQEGQRVFGENKVQDLCEKYQMLPNDIEWHFIGHLQTNKVKYIAPFVKLIHAVDSLKLLAEINKRAIQQERVINCLLQFHIANEASKFGLNLENAKIILESEAFKQLRNVEIVGVMGMATFTNDEEVIRTEFQNLKAIFTELKETFFIEQNSFSELSMGMSGDYEIALEEGSTMIRIGSKIFGARNY